ncbi:MAG TPA: lytic murein transglycosylase B [Casimicrobiaceae bacterium]|nr:lytic murein transglycosylase B [Casimicrobiaceae bacterium]
MARLGARLLLAWSIALLATCAAAVPVISDKAGARKPPSPPPAAHPAEPPSYGTRRDVRPFIDDMVAAGLNRRDVTRWLAAAKFQPKIIAAMQRPILEPPKWYEYSPQFLSDGRIAGGIAFWQAHESALARAEREYGVPAHVIVAIIGVETYYGRHTGSYRVIDALTTLAFDYPRRASYFRNELREFLLLARELGISPLEPKGSFAGAMGYPQFMPGSVRRYGVDFDGDGRIDLWTDGDDVIGSVAHYLARHDWLRGQPVLLPAVISTDGRSAVLQKLDGGISERRPLAAWTQDGVTAGAVPADLSPEPVGLLMLEERPGMSADDAGAASYWIACPNFYVITRYNKSRLYASAVWWLAEAILNVREVQRSVVIGPPAATHNGPN